MPEECYCPEIPLLTVRRLMKIIFFPMELILLVKINVSKKKSNIVVVISR